MNLSKAGVPETISQLIFPGFVFGQDDPKEAERLVKMGVGGFCLYGGRPDEVASLVGSLQKRARIPLLFCADYEDGIASQCPGGTRFPSNMALGAAGDEGLAYKKALYTAREARAMGVRWVLAPVLDLATCPGNPIVNIRSFGESATLVAGMGLAYIQGLREGRVLSCAKHFPGHGETYRDSHLELPVLNVSKSVLLNREIAPFERVKRQADAMMVGHLKAQRLDPRLPASLSTRVVGELLRGRLRYDGLTVTDALSMRAISKSFPEEKAALLAVKAGVDILLVPSRPMNLLRALLKNADSQPDFIHSAEAAFKKVIQVKSSCGLLGDCGLVSPRDLDIIGSQEHRSASSEMARRSITWARRGSGFPQPLRQILYLEPAALNESCWQGSFFIEELKSLGGQVHVWRSSLKASRKPTGQDDPVLVVGTFHRPRAYSGRIQLESREVALAQKAVRRPRRSVIVSFGNPFVLEQLHGFGAALCAFSDLEISQRWAARVLMGLEKAAGHLPVTIGK